VFEDPADWRSHQPREGQRISSQDSISENLYQMRFSEPWIYCGMVCGYCIKIDPSAQYKAKEKKNKR
jgi:hypothetical protein